MMLFNINHNILTELKYEEVEIVECDPWPPPTYANTIWNRRAVKGPA